MHSCPHRGASPLWPGPSCGLLGGGGRRRGTLIMSEVRSERAKKHYVQTQQGWWDWEWKWACWWPAVGEIRAVERCQEETDAGTGDPIPPCCVPKNISLLEQGGRKYFLGAWVKSWETRAWCFISCFLDGFLLLPDYSLIIVLDIYRPLALGQTFTWIILWKPNQSPLSRHFGRPHFTDEETQSLRSQN